MKAFAKAIALLSPNCKEASRLQSQALDRKLPWVQRFGLRIHLLLCEWCRRYGKQIRFLRDTTREHPEHLPEPGCEKLSQNARERIKQRLQTK